MSGKKKTPRTKTLPFLKVLGRSLKWLKISYTISPKYLISQQYPISHIFSSFTDDACMTCNTNFNCPTSSAQHPANVPMLTPSPIFRRSTLLLSRIHSLLRWSRIPPLGQIANPCMRTRSLAPTPRRIRWHKRPRLQTPTDII